MKNCQKQEKPNRGFSLQERDKRLLVDLFASRVMSRDQIIETGYFSSVPRANNRLAMLVRQGFVSRYLHETRGAGSQALYRAGRKAKSIVAGGLGYESETVSVQLGQGEAPMHLEHTLGLVDLRVLFEAGAKECLLKEFTWLPEALCHHEYLVSFGHNQWQRRDVRPDAVAMWQGDDGKRVTFIELDLGHVSSKKYAGKVASYRQYQSDGAFEAVYEASSFTVLTITTGSLRLKHLKKLCHGNSFHFTTFSKLKQLGPFQLQWETRGGFASILGECR